MAWANAVSASVAAFSASQITAKNGKTKSSRVNSTLIRTVRGQRQGTEFPTSVRGIASSTHSTGGKCDYEAACMFLFYGYQCTGSGSLKSSATARCKFSLDIPHTPRSTRLTLKKRGKMMIVSVEKTPHHYWGCKMSCSHIGALTSFNNSRHLGLGFKPTAQCFLGFGIRFKMDGKGCLIRSDANTRNKKSEIRNQKSVWLCQRRSQRPSRSRHKEDLNGYTIKLVVTTHALLLFEHKDEHQNSGRTPSWSTGIGRV